LAHLGLGHFLAQHFAHDGVQQQAGRGVGVVGVLFDQRARGQDGRLVDLIHGHAVIEVAHGLGHDGVGLDVRTQVHAGGLDQCLQAAQVQGNACIAVQHVQQRGGCHRGLLLALASALLGAAFAVQHVGAGHFVVAAAHQAQLHMVLHVFNMEGAATGARAHQCPGHVVGQGVHHFADAGGCCPLRSVHCQKGLHHCHCNLLRFERHHSAIAANDLVVCELIAGCCRRVGLGFIGVCRAGLGGGRRVQSSLHGCPLLWAVWSGRAAQVGAAMGKWCAGLQSVAHYIWCVMCVQDTTGSVPPEPD